MSWRDLKKLIVALGFFVISASFAETSVTPVQDPCAARLQDRNKQLLIKWGASEQEADRWQSNPLSASLIQAMLGLDQWLSLAPAHFYDLLAMEEPPAAFTRDQENGMRAVRANTHVQDFEVLLDQDINGLNSQFRRIFALWTDIPPAMHAWTAPLIGSYPHLFLLANLLATAKPLRDQNVPVIDFRRDISVRASLTKIRRFIPSNSTPLEFINMVPSVLNAVAQVFVETQYRSFLSPSDARAFRRSIQQQHLNTMVRLTEWLQATTRYYVQYHSVPGNYSQAPDEWKKAFREFKIYLSTPLNQPLSSMVSKHQGLLAGLNQLYNELLSNFTPPDWVPGQPIMLELVPMLRFYSDDIGRAAKIVNMSRCLLGQIDALTGAELEAHLHAEIRRLLLLSLRRYDSSIYSVTPTTESHAPSPSSDLVLSVSDLDPDTPSLTDIEPPMFETPLLPADYSTLESGGLASVLEGDGHIERLVADQPYQIRFLRLHPSYQGPQTILFTKDAVQALVSSQRAFGIDGIAFLRAIQVGIARYSGQQGLKPMAFELKDFYEVKVLATSYRLIGKRRSTDGAFVFERMIKTHKD